MDVGRKFSMFSIFYMLKYRVVKMIKYSECVRTEDC